MSPGPSRARPVSPAETVPGRARSTDSMLAHAISKALERLAMASEVYAGVPLNHAFEPQVARFHSMLHTGRQHSGPGCGVRERHP